MASNLKAARQSLDVARPTRASQAKSRQSTIGGSVQNEQSAQGKLVQPRWNVSTKISSPAETADQKMEKFRKREKALSHKSPGAGAWNRSDVSNPGSSSVDLQAKTALAISVHEPSAQPHPPVCFTSSENQAIEPQDGVAPASTGSGIVTKEKLNEPKGFSLEKLRACVREEAHTDKSSPEFFNNIWKKMGCSVDFLNEVEYWIMMIGIEELELENRNNPNRLLISDLPAEILSQILGKLDPVSRLVTRNVSTTLRLIVDSEKPTIKCIELWEHPFGIQIRFLPLQRDVTFYQIENGCLVYWRRNETYMKGDHYIRLALQFLEPLLSNPKLKLVQFHAWLKENSSVSQKLFDLMSDVVKSNNTPFHVEKLAIFGYTEKQLGSWLPLFKSGVLHNLRVVMKSESKVVSFLESEQFKGAKSINFIPIGGLKPSLINHFLHFDSFRVRLQFITINDILRLMENLATSVIFKQCEIEVLVYLDLNAIEEAFEVLPAEPVKQGGLLYVEVHYVQFSLCFWFRKRRFMIERKLNELS
ncbi:unnamed protein product [Caenorhabditis brenneri]